MKWLALEISSLLLAYSADYFRGIVGKVRKRLLVRDLQTSLFYGIQQRYENELFYNDLDNFLSKNKVISEIIRNCLNAPVSQYSSKSTLVEFYIRKFEEQYIVAKAIAYYRSLRNRNYVFSGSGNALFNPRVRYLPTAADDLNANLCDFIEDRCIFIPIEEKRGIHTDDLYQAYRQYCADYNETPISNEKAFSRKVLEIYSPHVKKEKWRKPGAANPTAGFYGIALTPMQQVYNV